MIERENPWMYHDGPLKESEVPIWAKSFVYKISKLDEFDNVIKIYIGKKQLTSTKKSKIGIRAQVAQKKLTGDGRVKKVRRVTKASGWQGYWSSCAELKQEVAEHPELFVREILQFAFSKKNATYLELKYMFHYDVLERDTYNSNINGSIFRYDTDVILYENFIQRKKDKAIVNKLQNEIK